MTANPQAGPWRRAGRRLRANRAAIVGAIGLVAIFFHPIAGIVRFLACDAFQHRRAQRINIRVGALFRPGRVLLEW